jgi:hypothetical protein
MDPKIDYLYGDSTRSPLTTDFIAFLRDAFDFAVDVLQRDGAVSDAVQRANQLSDATDREIAAAEALVSELSLTLDRVTVGDGDSLAARCSARIRSGIQELVRAEVDASRAAVGTERARAQQAAESARRACARAFETLLLHQDLPDAVTSMKLTVETATQYDVQLRGRTPYGLAWVLGVEVPPQHPLARVLRVEQIVERLQIEAPEEAGWIHKEVKIRPQRIDRLYLAELAVDPSKTILKLRGTPDGTGAGFDLSFWTDSLRIDLVRVVEPGVANPEPPYEVVGDDAAKLRSLRDALVAHANELVEHKHSLISASLDDTAIHELEPPRVLVERLIANMAPAVEEISRRSLMPGELVLKRLLGGNHREEVFVSKADLLSKLEPLPVALRRVFEPLKLWEPTEPAPAGADPTIPKAERWPASGLGVPRTSGALRPVTRAMATPVPPTVENRGPEIESTGKWPGLHQLDAEAGAGRKSV